MKTAHILHELNSLKHNLENEIEIVFTNTVDRNVVDISIDLLVLISQQIYLVIFYFFGFSGLLSILLYF